MNEIVIKIRDVREQRNKLEKLEKELISSFPLLTCDIESIYKSFVHLNEIKSIESIHHKKIFVFVSLSMLSPTFFLGDRIKIGTRNDISKITYLSASRISNIANEVRFLYHHYKDFRQEADYLYNSIKQSLLL